MKQGYHSDIVAAVTENNAFRRVLYTGQHMQIVAMTLQSGEDIGAEIHEGHDQFFRFESGGASVMIDETTYEVSAGDVVIIPSGANHNVTNTGNEPVRLYTIYTPPEHADGTVHDTKEIAEADDEHFDGTTTE